MSKQGIRASRRMQNAPTITLRAPEPAAARGGDKPGGSRGSLPVIEVGETALGRESLAAIEAEGLARGSLPAIEIGEAPLGRESLAAIDADERSEIPEGSPFASAPDVEVRAELDSDATRLPPPLTGRATQPWTESAEDAVRAAEAARLGRKLAPPTIEVRGAASTVDADELPPSSKGQGPPPSDAAPPGASAAGGEEPPPSGAPVRPKLTVPRPSPPSKKRRHNSGVELWRQALDEMITPGSDEGTGGAKDED
jgi:hypothetical protein